MSGDQHYVRRTSFETGPVEDWSVSGSTVALLAGSTVHLVGESVDRIELESKAQHVGLNDKLFVLDSGTIEAFSISGTRLWTAEIKGAEGIAAPNKCDFIIVPTAEDQLLGVDAAAGYERFAVDRPDSDVAATPEIVCTDESMVVAAWSFLSILKPTGETRLRTTLDGVIHDVGVVDSTVVCVMKDDRLVGITVETGEQIWSHEWVVDRIDPFAREELLVRTSEGIRTITPDGAWHELPLDDGLPVAAAGGDPVCIVVDSVVNVYARTTGEADVEARVLPDVVDPTDDSIGLEIKNVSDTPSVTTVAVNVDGADSAIGTGQIALSPGEREPVRVGLESIRSESIEIEVTLDEELATTATVSVAEDVDVLAVSTELIAAEPDGWTVAVNVKNTAEVPVHGIELEPAGRTCETLAGGKTWDETVSYSGKDVVLSVAGTDRSIEMSVPDEALAADARFEDGVIVVTVSNETAAQVVDMVRIQSEALPQEFEHEFDGGADTKLVVVAPPTAAGNVAVRVDGRLVSERSTVEVPQTATNTSRLGADQSVDTSPPRTDVAEPTTPDVDLAAQDAAASTKSEDDSAEPDRDSAAGTSFPLELKRRFGSDHQSVESSRKSAKTGIGQIHFEYIDVANRDTKPKQVMIASDGSETDIVIDPNESRTFVRAHVFAEKDEQIPGVAVKTDAGYRSADAVEPSFEVVDWYCLAAIVPAADEPLLRLEIVNQNRTRLSLSELSLRSVSLAEPPAEIEVGPQSTTIETIPVSGPPLEEWESPGLLSFSAGFAVSSVESHQTLVALPTGEKQGFPELEFTIDGETVFHEETGTIAIEVENTGAQVINELSMEASGDQLRTILYEGLTVESLGRNESVIHYVDVGDPKNGIDVSVDLLAGNKRKETVRLVADEPATTAVEVKRPQLADPEEMTLPTRISTAFSLDADEFV